jgi:hypothetical protein
MTETDELWNLYINKNILEEKEATNNMKRSIFAILMAVLLVIMVPAMALAASPSDSKSNFTASIWLMCVDRDTQLQVIKEKQNGLKVGEMTGSTYYQGIVVTSSIPGFIGTPIVGIENVDYIGQVITNNGVDEMGTIIKGKVEGTLYLNAIYGMRTANYLPGGYSVIPFNSKVSGNISLTPGSVASDIGTWKTDTATDSLSVLTKAKGDWNACVTYSTFPEPFTGTGQLVSTFSGYATISGKLK